jgi:hypothetical protein
MVIARQTPQICLPMIPFCSRFDSVLFTPKMPAIAGRFNFSRSPVDLGAALAALLIADPAREPEQLGRLGFERGIALDLAGNVADDAAEIGLRLAQRLLGAAKLVGMGIALVPDEGDLAAALIGLAQLDAEFLCELDQLLARPVHQLGIGREGDVPGAPWCRQ